MWTTSAFDAADYASMVDRIEGWRDGGEQHDPLADPRQLFVEDPNGVRIEINVKARRGLMRAAVMEAVGASRGGARARGAAAAGARRSC